MNQAKLRFIIWLLIWLVKTGQIKNILKLIIWVLKAKIDYDETIGRLDGSYYDKLIDKAVEDYNSRHPITTNINVPGYQKWLESQAADPPSKANDY